MANKLHSGKVGPWLRPTEQCLLRRFFQALFQPPRLPDPPRSRLRFPIPFFPPFLSPLSFSPPPSLPPPFLRFLIPHPCFTGALRERRINNDGKSRAPFAIVHRFFRVDTRTSLPVDNSPSRKEKCCETTTFIVRRNLSFIPLISEYSSALPWNLYEYRCDSTCDFSDLLLREISEEKGIRRGIRARKARRLLEGGI